MHARMCARMHTHSHTHHKCMHACAHARTCTHTINACMYVHTHARAHTHKHTNQIHKQTASQRQTNVTKKATSRRSWTNRTTTRRGPLSAPHFNQPADTIKESTAAWKMVKSGWKHPKFIWRLSICMTQHNVRPKMSNSAVDVLSRKKKTKQITDIHWVLVFSLARYVSQDTAKMDGMSGTHKFHF